MPEEIVVADRPAVQAPPQTETPAQETENGIPAEERRGAESSSFNLGDLSHEAYEKYMKTGKLPPEIEPRPKALTPDELDPLSKLSREERNKWVETGEMPERLLEKTENAPVKVESREPEFVRLGEAITPETHAAAVKTYNERMNKAWKAAGDHEQIIKEAASVFPKLCGGNKHAANNLLEFLDNASAHMDHPAEGMREFVRNAEFRGKLEKATPDQALAILRDFDRNYRTPKRIRVPAPATSITGKSTAPVDEENAALSKGDVTAYFEAANRADRARSQGRR